MFFFMWPLRFFLTFLIFFLIGRGVIRLVRSITGNQDPFPGRRLSSLSRRFLGTLSPDGNVAGSSENADARRSSAFESEVFRLADKNRGRITLSDVVLETGRGMKESEELLEQMVDGSHVRLELDDRGIVYYEFPEIIRRYEG